MFKMELILDGYVRVKVVGEVVVFRYCNPRKIMLKFWWRSKTSEEWYMDICYRNGVDSNEGDFVLPFL